MEKINTIKEMYKEDRPYEKCEKFGAENLTDTELLAILIRTGTKGENSLELSRKLLYKNGFHNGLAGIHKWSLDELIQIKGIGKVKAIQLVCLSELSKRLARTSTVGKLDFSSPRTIADYYMEDMRHRTREILKLIFLNTAGIKNPKGTKSNKFKVTIRIELPTKGILISQYFIASKNHAILKDIPKMPVIFKITIMYNNNKYVIIIFFIDIFCNLIKSPRLLLSTSYCRMISK